MLRKKKDDPASPSAKQGSRPSQSNTDPSRQGALSRDGSGTSLVRRLSRRSKAETARAQHRRLKCCPLTTTHYDEAERYHRPVTKSRLYTNLHDIISDNNARACFLQFLEGTEVVHTVQFLHDAYCVYQQWRQMPSSPRDEELPHQRRLLDAHFGNDAAALPIPPETQVKLTTRPDAASLAAAIAAVESALQQVSLPAFLRSQHYAAMCSALLTSPELRLEDIVHNDEVLMVFMQFLERHNASTVIHFWLLADNFANTFDATSPEQRKEDALGIYNRFFSLQSPEPLGVDEQARTAVEANICSDAGVGRECFAEPDHIVYTALRLHFFPLFRESEDFSHYLAELSKHGLDDSGAHPHSHVGTKHVRKYSHDPSCLGYVDHFGLYIRDAAVAMEPSLDTDLLLTGIGVGIGSRMKKAFGRSSQTPQEELFQAWEAAKSVVHEIREQMFKTGVLYRPQLA
ncbi:hypothetical protein PTSG_06604 [Salpingoeca rosetta]|uniref:RGS domain-containing protein n=1 Tax=Salpingoeca rosetta (strain ATCC 50818 / BSB-021) TaxID=946362 RepID=F2UFG6_SALR5|nr:uncharacterized protein PTSG_06604 [Salpingoeca rosetta]EGD75534.1 hypothetical protein PTSG_06604 [Salpingoeca rosetta]|eukprot:XP_004991991.1 hypothetical protein PTSG_06604 [Salpingoeca rosetta]